MATRTLYLGNTATASPFPTTSKKLEASAPASEVQLGPGEFDSGFPGNTDAGQWNPSSPIADTTSAAEIDNTGASLGTTRQGWLLDEDLTGVTLASGNWTVQLRLRANQGTGTTGEILMRATVVTGSAGAWTTVANLCTTRITGETSHSTGQDGWRDQDEAAITVTSTAANFSVTIASATAHTFTSGQRLLLEFGFGNANNTTDRTWRLDYNTSNSFVTTPDMSKVITVGDSNGIATAESVEQPALTPGAVTITVGDSNGIATAESVEQPAVSGTGGTQTITIGDGNGIATAEAVATDAVVTPGAVTITIGDGNGIASAEAVATDAVVTPGAVTITIGDGNGIATAESVEQPAVGYIVALDGIASAEAVATDAIITPGAVTITVGDSNGIATAESVEQPAVAVVQPVIIGDGNGIATAETVATDAVVTPGAVAITIGDGNGIATAESVEQPAVAGPPQTVTIGDGNGITTAEAVGSPALVQVITLGEGIGSSDATPAASRRFTPYF